MIRKTLVLVLIFGGCLGVHAAPPPGLAAAKSEYDKAQPAGNEAARAAYVQKLAVILDGMIGDKMKTGRTKDPAAFDALYAELKRHPLPKDAPSDKLSKLRVGKWQSPRHTYIFQANGTWHMSAEDGGAGGHWKIEGNQYHETADVQTGYGKDRYTLICLDQKRIIFTDGELVFYESRL